MSQHRRILVPVARAALAWTPVNPFAQARGLTDWPQNKEIRVNSPREQMEIKDDSEWLASQLKVNEVHDARADQMSSVLLTRSGKRGVNDIEASPAFGSLQKAIREKARVPEVKEQQTPVCGIKKYRGLQNKVSQ
jgi:hypothetical protein